ncbi:structural maintenance of chromosomes 56 smc5 smc6 [Holotrichia oblita]|uniref:Structural maintenance of chromosomes 56 smc5 smc6 n=1 Tax=Holotrichia oblita TaxID=644536 RepID=A0ACB9TKR1_HOLOL|nr:structural maintenance of chromosomes 56 smc5 smc6 [Holotrichia oblita]
MSGTRKRALTQSNLQNTAIKEKRSKSDHESICNTSKQNGIKRRAGTISQITLKNFMCHSHLEVNLTNNINYITGRNGSGKSAILTALIVGLAGKASVTNRGTSIKSKVIMVLRENKYTASYTSSTLMLGQTVARTPKEIQHILSNLNIQIDNPVCILNQDTSRNFLSTSDPKQKFVLFMRATRLETLDQEYKTISGNRRDIIRIYQEKEKIYEELKNLLKELETKIESIKGIAELKKRVNLLNSELSWAKVRDIEHEYNDRVRIVEGLQTKCNRYEDNSINKNQRLEEIKQKANELQQQIMELKEAAEVQNRPQLDVQNEIDGLRQSYSEKRRLKQRLMKDIQDKNQNIATLTVEIENFTANLSKIEQEKLVKKKEMSDLEAQIGHIENMTETTQNDVFQMKSSISRQEEQENDLHRESRQIKARYGQTVARTPKEIQHILSNLNIQIDNPVCILNQDTSRNFLSTSDPKQKFVLFMRATRLETLDQEYKTISGNRRDIIRIYQEKEKIYEELKNLLKELETKIESIKGIAELKKRVNLLNSELSWAKVRDIEHEYNDRVRIVEGLQTKCNRYEDNSINKNQRLEEIKQKANELQQQIMELKEAAEVQNRPQLDVQNEIDGLRQSYSEKRRLKQRLMKDIQDKNQNIATLTVEIENFTANLSKIEQEKLVKKKEMSDLEAQIGHIENMTETTQNDVFQMKSSISRQEEQENDLHRESRQIKARYDQVTDQINTLKSESNSLIVYGRDMPEIVNAIHRNEKKFTHLPRGPLGAFINIRDKKWDVAIEGYIGTGLLRSFTVDNKKDNAILMEIFNRHCTSGQKPMVITSKFFNRVHNIVSNLVRADRDCISLYDAIDIKDPVVANCLIDQMSIESILLIPSTERAIELLSNQNRVPRNCSQGVTVKGDKYYPDPNYKTYASRYHKARYLQVDAGDLIRGCEETLAELKSKMKNVQAQINAVVMDKSKQKRELAELTKKLEKLRQTNFVAKRKLEDLRTMEDSEAVNVQSLVRIAFIIYRDLFILHIGLQEIEMTELKGVVQRLTAQHEETDQQMKTIKEHINESERRLAELVKATQGFEDRIAPLEVGKDVLQQIREQANKKQELDVNRTFEKKRLQETRNKLVLAQSDMLNKKEELNKLTDEAISVGERVEELRQVPEVVMEIKNVQTTIRRVESSLETPDEIRKKYQHAREKCEQVKKVMGGLEDTIQELNQSVSKRRRHYQVMEDYFVNCINHNFSKVLDFRQFKGRMEINMAEKKLELIVIPQQGSQGLTVTSNLSGGERSFSTVAFLYSLWQCMNFPFYFLDEFDVYMRRPGAISRITLKNFMCHAHLEVNFKNNINYITGRNGSGKSAILTALVVGLAGKASITNRGTSIKNFVKAGQTSANVEIVLNNTGSLAYKREVYGNEIIIQRSFNINGSSIYRTKSSTGIFNCR